jgi:hypothetical protein
MVAAGVAKAVIKNTHRATEAMLWALKCPSNLAHASLAATLAYGPRVGKQPLWRVLPPLHKSRSYGTKKRPSDEKPCICPASNSAIKAPVETRQIGFF